MPRVLIHNDFHCGVSRVGGTTPASQVAMEEWQLSELERILQTPHDQLIILGDLCDKRVTQPHLIKHISDILRPFKPLIIQGNHDSQGKQDHTISSCELISYFSQGEFINEPGMYGDNIYIVPHMFNQELFDAEIEKVPENQMLLVHCNIDSPFAQGDHSLNLSKKQIKSLEKKNVHIICAHEHKSRKPFKNVTCIGNQIPTSIADCIGEDVKYAGMIEDGEFNLIEVQDMSEIYTEFDYSQIGRVKPLKFTRITGEVSPTEYVDIRKAYNELRRTSDAFVIKNDVRIMTDEVEVTKEEVTNFNVVELLLGRMKPEYRKKVEECV
jgi:DNA repair exonuclease SbcCD nuclease subunit